MRRLAAITISCFLFLCTHGQYLNDTIWGNGVFSLKDADGTAIANDTIFCKPIDMPGDTIPDTTYSFITNAGGQVLFELPVCIDLISNIDDNKTMDSQVVPNPGSDFNVALHGEATGDLHIYNTVGQLVKEVKIDHYPSKNVSHAYIDMSDQAFGNYIFKAHTSEGQVSGKIVKTNTSKVGRRTITAPNLQTKNSNSFEALYNIQVTHPGYYDLEEDIIIAEGFNNLIPLIMQEPPPPPQYQHIGGTVKDEDSNPVQNATVWIKELGSDELLGETVTNIDGTYLLPEPVSVGTDFYFGVGDVVGMYSYVGDEYSVPNQILEFEDTINCNFKYVLYNRHRPIPDNPADSISVSAFKFRHLIGVKDLNLTYGLYDTIRFYIGNNISIYEAIAVRGQLEWFEQATGIGEVFYEVDYELNIFDSLTYPDFEPANVGINIIDLGNGPNGQSIGWPYENPLGNMIFTRIGGEFETLYDTSTTIHELGHALGLNHVGGAWSFMYGFAPMLKETDKIMLKMSFDHSKKIWSGQSYYSLENISEALPIEIQSCPGTPTVEDINGHIYNTVLIGEQCWLKAELRTGYFIFSNQAASNNGVIEKYCFSDNPNMYPEGFYTWDEMMNYTQTEGAQGVCPDGWHIPTDYEWSVLEGFVDTHYDSTNTIWENFGWRGYDAGQMLKVENLYNGWNLYEFSILDLGYRYNGGFENFNSDGYYWTSSTDNEGNPIFRHFNIDHNDIERLSETNQDHAYQVRCIKD